VYPIPPAPRTAVVSRAFRSTGSVRVFETIESIPAFHPEAIAGRIEDVESLAGAIGLTHAIVIFHDPGEPLLTGLDRDRLWRMFEVPVFEQILAADGTLLAAECEAHEGLHVESVIEGYEVESSACGCGRPTPRIVRELVKTRVAATT
jgi:hypothetical protein